MHEGCCWGWETFCLGWEAGEGDSLDQVALDHSHGLEGGDWCRMQGAGPVMTQCSSHSGVQMRATKGGKGTNDSQGCKDS